MGKFLLFIAFVVGSFVWIRTNVTTDNILAYAKKNEAKEWAPKVEYWTGLYHYERENHEQAEKAFTQLLAHHATSYYGGLGRIKLAQTYNKSMRFDPALEQFRRYLEDFPDGEMKAIAEKRIQMLENRGP